MVCDLTVTIPAFFLKVIAIFAEIMVIEKLGTPRILRRMLVDMWMEFCRLEWMTSVMMTKMYANLLTFSFMVIIYHFCHFAD